MKIIIIKKLLIKRLICFKRQYVHLGSLLIRMLFKKLNLMIELKFIKN